MALADRTKALYNAIIRKKLLTFCKEHRIDNLNEKFTDLMDSFGGFLLDEKVYRNALFSVLPGGLNEGSNSRSRKALAKA